ncbi:MAG: hypothetical protein IPH76_19015 [Xanthomonadales bacterium]|nr:hypothetical protein [Xanthomonadales bacterium]
MFVDRGLRPSAQSAGATTKSRSPTSLAGRSSAKYPDAGVAAALRAPVGSSRIEFWNVPTPPQIERHRHFTLRQSGDWLFGSIEIDRAGRSPPPRRSRLRAVAGAQPPARLAHLSRTWNYFGAINAGDGDDEALPRLRRWPCGVIAQPPAERFAAATAIGIPAPPDQLHVHWLAAKQPGIAIENPRQVPAFEYPRDYGPIAPVSRAPCS